MLNKGKVKTCLRFIAATNNRFYVCFFSIYLLTIPFFALVYLYRAELKIMSGLS